VDYPLYAEAVALRIQSGASERGILICGSGVGASIAANKFRGIRAGLCHDIYSAHQGVEHDHMNILVLGSRVVGTELAKDLVERFLAAIPSQEERHLRRLREIEIFEERWSGEDELLASPPTRKVS
jgi:RpiB/LacA/LacB family sugar-phosphate isomerase